MRARACVEWGRRTSSASHTVSSAGATAVGRADVREGSARRSTSNADDAAPPRATSSRRASRFASLSRMVEGSGRKRSCRNPSIVSPRRQPIRAEKHLSSDEGRLARGRAPGNIGARGGG